MTKQEARNFFLQKRSETTAALSAELNEALFNSFLQLPDLVNYRHIHIFLPIANKLEPDTWPIVRYIWKNYPHIILSAPVANLEKYLMHAEELKPDTKLITNKWGIPEPFHSRVIASNEIDLCFVPLLGCDFSGNRVGYGKGFYDRFLADCRPDVVKAGLGWFEPVDVIEDLNPHDIPLNAYVYSKGIYHF